MASYKDGTLWKPTLHGYFYFEYRQQGTSSEWIPEEREKSLEDLLERQKARGNHQPIPRIIDLGGTTYQGQFYNNINTTIKANQPTGITPPIRHNPVDFVKNYVKGYPDVVSEFKERLVFCSQRPLNDLISGQKNCGIRGSIATEPGLPEYVKLSSFQIPKNEPSGNAVAAVVENEGNEAGLESRSGIPFEMVICGKTAEEKTSLLYSVHSFKYGKFRFFYSSEIDAIDEDDRDSNISTVIPVEIKAYHPSSTDTTSLYRHKLKQAFVKAKLSNIPRIYLGIDSPKNPFVYDSIRIYDEQHLGKMSEHCKKNLPDDDFWWTTKSLYGKMENFSTKMDDFLRNSMKTFTYKC